MVHLRLFLILTVTGVASESRLFFLSDLTSTSSIFTGLEASAKLFVSSHDDPDALRRIFISNSDRTLSIFNLTTSTTIAKTALLLNDPNITVTNGNTAEVTKTLNGIIYVTTAAQAKDVNFRVFEVQPTETTLQIESETNSTFVFFNSPRDSDEQPEYRSIVTIKNSTTVLGIFSGLPVTNATIKEIFRNPVLYGEESYFFPNIEPLPIYSRFFQLRTNGKLLISLRGQYDNRTSRVATWKITTGMISSNYEVFRNQTVKFISDLDHDGVCGIFFNFYVEQPMKATYYEGAETSSLLVDRAETYFTGTYYTGGVPDTLLVGAANQSIVGEVTLQYFVIEGDVATTTTTTATTTTTEILQQMTTTEILQRMTTTDIPQQMTTTAIPQQTTTQSGASLSMILTFAMILIVFVHQ